jgi:cyclin T
MHLFKIIINYQLSKIAPRDLAEAAYLTATNSLILTNFCVKFSSEKVACFCIYLACKWTGLRVSIFG